MTILIQKSFQPVAVRVTHSPTHSVLATLSLLSADVATNSAEPWLKNVAERMTESEKTTNDKIFATINDALLHDNEYSVIYDYLTFIGQVIDPTVGNFMQESRSQKNKIVVTEYLTQIEAVNHFRHMWRTYFLPDWERQHHLKSIVDNLNTRDWPTQSAESALQAFLRRPVPDFIGRQLDGVSNLAFVLSPWLNLQASRFGSADTLWIFVPADPRNLPMRYEPIQRSEAMRVASALADDARLQILEMLAAFGPMRSQEMLEQLGVSQPTVSRQLKQLKNTGFISERRDGNASKIFGLNPDRLGEVMFMLETLLSKGNARMVLNDARLDQPAELRKFLNEAGQVYRYPNKLNAQKLIIDYLAPKFEKGKRYSEKEVNELLNRWHTYKDPARLRRDLVDYDYLQRTADGSAYWRP